MTSYVSEETRKACDDLWFTLGYVRGALESALGKLSGNSPARDDIESALDAMTATRASLKG